MNGDNEFRITVIEWRAHGAVLAAADDAAAQATTEAPWANALSSLSVKASGIAENDVQEVPA